MSWPSNCNETTTTCWALNKTLILVEWSSWWTIHNALPLWWHLGALNYRYAWNMWQELCLSLILAKPMGHSVFVLDTYLFETIGCAAGPCLQPLCSHQPAAPIRLGLENNVKWTNNPPMNLALMPCKPEASNSWSNLVEIRLQQQLKKVVAITLPLHRLWTKCVQCSMCVHGIQDPDGSFC